MRQLFTNIGLFFQQLFGAHHTTVTTVSHITPTPTSALIQQANQQLTILPATGPSDWMWVLVLLCFAAGVVFLFYSKKLARH